MDIKFVINNVLICIVEIIDDKSFWMRGWMLLNIFIFMIMINNCFWIMRILFIKVWLLVWIFFNFGVYRWYIDVSFYVVIVVIFVIIVIFLNIFVIIYIFLNIFVIIVIFFLGRGVMYIFDKVFFYIWKRKVWGKFKIN